MSGLFDVYQTNVKMLFQKIANNLDSISTETENKLTEIEKDLLETQKLLKNLEIEVAGESPVSDIYLIVKNYKNGYAQYNKRYKKEKEKFENNIKSVSLGININKNFQNEEIAYNSFNKLQNARRVTIEMEGIGEDVMRDMNGQSDIMKGINSKIGDISNDLNSSTTLISEMQKIQRRNKAIIYLYGAFLIFLFLIIAFFRIYPKFKSNSPNPNSQIIKTNNTNISKGFHKKSEFNFI